MATAKNRYLFLTFSLLDSFPPLIKMLSCFSYYVENSSLKSLPTSLYEREEKYFPL